MQLVPILLIRNKLFSLNRLIIVLLIGLFVYTLATNFYRENFATPPYDVPPNYIKYTIFYGSESGSGSGSGSVVNLSNTNEFILNPDPLASYSGVVVGSVVQQQ